MIEMKSADQQNCNLPLGWLTVLFFLFSLQGITAQKQYVVHNRDVSIKISDEGKITGITSVQNHLDKKLTACTSIAGTKQQGVTRIMQKKNGSVEWIKTLLNDSLHTTCQLVERLIPAGNSIRWEIEILGSDTPWSAAINTELIYPVSPESQFWTAWGAPPDKRNPLPESLQPVPGGSLNTEFVGLANNQWTDPLQPVPFLDTVFYYGLPYYNGGHPSAGLCPFDGNLFCIPICSILERASDQGVSIVLSPADDLIDLTLRTDEKGKVLFSRLFNRISKNHLLKFHVDLIAHAADWRSGLGWMTERYPEYFKPKNIHSEKLAGTDAYSDIFNPADSIKLRQLGFRTNWKASFDFPYMGMFLPPVKKNVHWKSFGGPSNSIDQMEHFAASLKKEGFHLLSYFNVTEFGTKIQYPPPAEMTTEPSQRWKNGNDFLFYAIPGTMLADPISGEPLYTWEDAVATDCGNPVYKDFLLQQARRHIREIPSADGICIDRLDWLRLFNFKADDGKTWVAGKPVRSLIHSFKELMDTLGPMMHAANKNIFLNNHDKRIDILKQADGLFDEFTFAGAPLNLTAFLCVEKTALGWTDTASTVKREGCDAFFQKYLYMGVYPMCPFPGNDHSIQPDPVVDSYYIDYTPLLSMLPGKEWVLKPHVAEIEQQQAKVNIFKTANGYMIPVVYGKSAKVRLILRTVFLNLHSLKPARYQAFYPGGENPVWLNATEKNGFTYLDIPLQRGCAVLLLTEEK